jgi:DNA-binding NarL/FixJ family response regulator
MVIIDVVPDGEDWQHAERMHILWARDAGWHLTNATDGGEGVSGLSAESRARIVAAWTGRKHRPESIAKIGAASRGRRHTEAYRQMMHRVMSERVFTPEHRSRLAAATRKFTPEQVDQIRGLLANGVSQYAIARQFGVHQGTISNIKQGRFYP